MPHVHILGNGLVTSGLLGMRKWSVKTLFGAVLELLQIRMAMPCSRTVSLRFMVFAAPAVAIGHGYHNQDGL
jgi:hypothetical protein